LVETKTLFNALNVFTTPARKYSNLQLKTILFIKNTSGKLFGHVWNIFTVSTTFAKIRYRNNGYFWKIGLDNIKTTAGFPIIAIDVTVIEDTKLYVALLLKVLFSDTSLIRPSLIRKFN
jgi:hypothetical protein